MINDQINARIESFVKELEALIRVAAMDAVGRALGGGAGASRSVAAGRVRTPAAAKKASSVAATSAPSAKLSFKRKKGAKRTPQQLAAIDAAAVAFVKANPGKGVEHMAKALGVPSDDIKSRVSLLIDSKKLKKTGVKRATKYYPG